MADRIVTGYASADERTPLDIPFDQTIQQVVDERFQEVGNDGTVGAALTAIRGGVAPELDTLKKVTQDVDQRFDSLNPAKLNVLTGSLNYVDTIDGLLASLAAGEPETHIKPDTTFSIGSDKITLLLDNQRLVSHNRSYVPLFQQTLGTFGPDDAWIEIWFENGELRGNWFGRGLEPTATNWENPADRNTYRSGIFMRSIVKTLSSGGYRDAFGLAVDYLGGQYLGTVFEARGHNAKVYKVHIDEIEGHELTGGLWHQYGTSTTFTSTYHTINRARANSKIIRYLPDWLKYGDNAGSGGSPGCKVGWAELYRGGRAVVTYSLAAPTAGTNGVSCRKLRFYDCSMRGQINNSVDLGAGTDIEFHSPTTDDSNYGMLIRETYDGTLKLNYPICKEARKSGIRNLSPTAKIVIERPQVGNNSFNFRSSYTVTPAAVGNGGVNNISDYFHPDAFFNDGDLIGTGTQSAAAGDWKIVFTSPTAYDLKRPNGTTAGSNTVGVTYTAGSELRLRVNAGSIPFVAGDVITLNVASLNPHRGVYGGIESEYPVTIVGGVSGVSLAWRLQAGWYGWKSDGAGGYYNAKDGDFLAPGIATSLNPVFKTVVTDPRSQIQIGADAFATRRNAVTWLNASREPYISAMVYSERAPEGGTEPLKFDIYPVDWRRAWTDWEMGFGPAGTSTNDPNAAPVQNRMARQNTTLSDGTGGSLIDGQSAATQAYGIRVPRASIISESPNCAGNVLGDMLLF